MFRKFVTKDILNSGLRFLNGFETDSHIHKTGGDDCTFPHGISFSLLSLNAKRRDQREAIFLLLQGRLLHLVVGLFSFYPLFPCYGKYIRQDIQGDGHEKFFKQVFRGF
jgi:hypothetical protein